MEINTKTNAEAYREAEANPAFEVGVEPNAANPAPDKDAPHITRRGIIGLLFALFLLAAAYVFTCIVPISGAPIGFFVLTAATFSVTLVVALLLGARPDGFSLLAMLAGLVFAFSRVINGGMRFDLYPAVSLTGAAYAFFAVALFKNHSRRLTGALILDGLKSAAYAFTSFKDFFMAIFRPEGAKKNGKTTLMTILGILIALVTVLIVAGLLSYDAHFAAMLPVIDLSMIIEVFTKLIFAVPLAAMAYSLLASSEAKRLPTLSTRENAERIGANLDKLPVLITVLPVIAVLVVYIMFFVSQWAYYMSAFTNRLPEGYSAAEYAREGFFNLLIVAVINAGLLLLLSTFTKKKTKSAAALLRGLSAALSTATLVLIATALSKLFLYISRFDLTRDRLTAMLILLLLAASFVAALLAALIKRVKAMPIIVVSGLALLLVFSLAGTNRLIAKYNVDAYLSGRHASIDVAYLANDLGFAAAPELARLEAEATDPAIKTGALTELRSMAVRLEGQKAQWYQKSIPFIRAEQLLKKINAEK